LTKNIKSIWDRYFRKWPEFFFKKCFQKGEGKFYLIIKWPRLSKEVRKNYLFEINFSVQFMIVKAWGLPSNRATLRCSSLKCWATNTCQSINDKEKMVWFKSTVNFTNPPPAPFSLTQTFHEYFENTSNTTLPTLKEPAKYRASLKNFQMSDETSRLKIYDASVTIQNKVL